MIKKKQRLKEHLILMEWADIDIIPPCDDRKQFLKDINALIKAVRVNERKNIFKETKEVLNWVINNG